MIRRTLSALLPALLIATPVHAQDDDLVPLVPTAKPKAKPKPKPAKPAPKPKPAPSSNDDDLVPLTPMKTELLVKVSGDVQGAKLYVDNKEVGTLPMGPQSVSAGDHAVLVKRPGFAPFTRKVQVGSGKTVELTAELKATMAVLNITSEPSGAQVFIGGKSLGVTPLENLEIAPGAITVVVKKEGYADARSDLTARVGKDYPVSVSLNPVAGPAVASRPAVEDRPRVTALTPPNAVTETPVTAETQVQSNPPIVTRWYFWVGVVAVAGAIAAGTAIGVSQANTTKPLTQEQICGGPCDACINCSAAFKF